MANSLQLNDHERTWANLNVTYMALRRARDLELARVGLTMPQAGVLWFLATSKEPLTPMKLSRLMSRQPHTLSALVYRMEVQGFVKTTKDLRRKNWVRVSLTKKGQAAFKRGVGQRAAMNVTACLSKDEEHELNAICKKLRANGVDLVRNLQPTPHTDNLF
jgi:MarR family transcriptional regulator, organic hydroperoxide resistance regulator